MRPAASSASGCSVVAVAVAWPSSSRLGARLSHLSHAGNPERSLWDDEFLEEVGAVSLLHVSIAVTVPLAPCHELFGDFREGLWASAIRRGAAGDVCSRRCVRSPEVRYRLRMMTGPPAIADVTLIRSVWRRPSRTVRGESDEVQHAQRMRDQPRGEPAPALPRHDRGGRLRREDGLRRRGHLRAPLLQRDGRYRGIRVPLHRSR